MNESATARLERWLKTHRRAQVGIKRHAKGVYVSLVWESRFEIEEQENVANTLDAAIHAALDAAGAER